MTSHEQTPTDRQRRAGGESRADRPTPGGVDRRSVLRGAAVGGLSLPLLAACGGSDGSGGAASDDSGSAAQESSSSASPSSGATSIAASEVPVGGGAILAAAKLVVTQPTKGQFKAFSAICTHQGCPVNAVTGGEIVCPCHGSHFSITDGSPTSGPAAKPLAARKVTVDGAQLSVS